MDYLRRCYSTTFRIYVGGVERLVPARWFFCRPGAKLFGKHCFGSHVWWDERDGDLSGPGEIDNSLGRASGANFRWQGRCFVGQRSWFETGQLPNLAALIPQPFPTCCYDTFDPIVFTARSRVARKGSVAGLAALQFAPRSGLAWGGSYAARLPFAFGARSAISRSGTVAGAAALALSARSAWQQLVGLVGTASLKLGAVARWNDITSRAGEARLVLAAGSAETATVSLEGDVALSLAPRSTWSEGEHYEGKAALAFTSRSSTGFAVAGKAPVTITAKSSTGFARAGSAGLAFTSRSSTGFAVAGKAPVTITAKSVWSAPVSYGGKASLLVAVGGAQGGKVKTSSCSSGAWATYTVVISGATGNCSAFNGTQTLRWITGETWTATGPDWTLTMVNNLIHWNLQGIRNSPNFTTFSYTLIGSYTCTGSMSWNLPFPSSGTMPATVTTNPVT